MPEAPEPLWGHASARDALDEAVNKVLNAAASLDLLHKVLAQNSASSSKLLKAGNFDVFRVHLLAPSETRAFEVIINGVLAAADELSEAYDAFPRHPRPSGAPGRVFSFVQMQTRLGWPKS